MIQWMIRPGIAAASTTPFRLVEVVRKGHMHRGSLKETTEQRDQVTIRQAGYTVYT
jgi:hypothetical protein